MSEDDCVERLICTRARLMLSLDHRGKSYGHDLRGLRHGILHRYHHLSPSARLRSHRHWQLGSELCRSIWCPATLPFLLGNQPAKAQIGHNKNHEESQPNGINRHQPASTSSAIPGSPNGTLKKRSKTVDVLRRAVAFHHYAAHWRLHVDASHQSLHCHCLIIELPCAGTPADHGRLEQHRWEVRGML